MIAGLNEGDILRLVLLATILATNPASAQSIDCDAVKHSSTPVMVGYHLKDGRKVNVQVYRDKSGNFITWSQQRSLQNTEVMVSKNVYMNGTNASVETWTPRTDKYRHIVDTLKIDGLPKNFDWRSDVRYSSRTEFKFNDNSTDQASLTISYQFKSEDMIPVGSCVLQAIHGEFDTIDDTTGKAFHTFRVYYPELQTGTATQNAEIPIDSVTTVFTEIKAPD